MNPGEYTGIYMRARDMISTLTIYLYTIMFGILLTVKSFLFDCTYFEMVFWRLRLIIRYAMHFWNHGAPYDQLTEVHNRSPQPSL